MILSVGEILVDMIGAETDHGFFYERKAGGAPFNVACAIKKMGGNCAFIGSVGCDLIGEFLIDTVKGLGIDGVVEQNKTRNTTLAFVNLDAFGERSFCFYRKHTADYVMPPIPPVYFEQASMIHFGSLMLSESEGREYLEREMERARQAGKKISFDVNFRDDIFPDKQTAVAIYKKFMEYADVIKFSEDEVALFTKEYVEKLSQSKLVCITLGKAGSRWMYQGRSNQVSSIAVTPIDTTGAGDAFYGAFLTKIDAQQWNDELLDQACRFGNVCGALNTTKRGAVDAIPTLEQVNQLI
ncbi:MAG: carbohydrate kinase [Clostridia bacterium]|nr:carbohydrate kinase [Clostridia bacterium]MBP3423106.1 carbohydrate kinase [Clostridia bacterium]